MIITQLVALAVALVFKKKEVSSINTGISALQVRGLPMDLVGAGHRSMCEASSQLSYGGIIKVIK